MKRKYKGHEERKVSNSNRLRWQDQQTRQRYFARCGIHKNYTNALNTPL